MRINNLRINSFGKLENRDLEFKKFNLKKKVLWVTNSKYNSNRLF